MNKEQVFWEWFQKNQAQFLFIKEVASAEKERMLEELMDQLTIYHDGLYFLLGSHSENDHELIITAEGMTAHFTQVRQLAEAAPQIKGWKVLAFKPPLGLEFTISGEGVDLNPNELYFKPLRSKADPDAVGVRVGLPAYQEQDREDLLELTYRVLDAVLGELSFAYDVDYVDIVQLPPDPEEHSYISLKRLAEFLEWNKNNPRNA